MTTTPATIVATVALAALAAGLGIGYAVADNSRSSGKIEGSGKSATETRTVPPFTSVDLTGAANVSITTGTVQKVSVTADDNLLSYITTTVDGGTLKIGSKPGSYSSHVDTHVDVTVPSLDALTLSGSGNITVIGVDATSLALMLKGAGNLSADGTVDELGATVSGAGNLELRELVAKRAVAEVSGTGRMAVHATESLDASVSGTGEIVYTGEPTHVTTSVSGTGSIRKG
jgi:Putative auto-transporter adhesin, head GIN domain